MKNHFQQALDFVIWWETGGDKNGAYHIDPHDPGGVTKWGISQKAYPDLDIKNITKHGASELYKNDYWNPCKCSDMPWPLGMVVFDAAVNVGVRRSSKFIQRALKVTDDGNIGPVTLKAIEKQWKHPKRLMAKAMTERENFYRIKATTGLSMYFDNWTRRVMELAIEVGGLL